jgi:peroxiredoxin
VKSPTELRKRLGAIGYYVVFFLVIWALAGLYQTRTHTGKAGAPAPTFTLLDLSGREVSLDEFRNKKVLLHFFATWCGVCKVELPSIRRVNANLDDDEVLLAIAEDADDVEALRSFAREHDLKYPILLATPEVLRAYGVSAFPTNYYVNGDGSVDSSSTGLATWLGMTLRLLAADSH